MQTQDLELMNISNLVSIPQTEARLCPISVGSTQSGSPLTPWRIWERLKDKGKLKPSPSKPEILCWVDDYPLYSICYSLSYLATVLKIEKFKKKKKKQEGLKQSRILWDHPGHENLSVPKSIYLSCHTNYIFFFSSLTLSQFQKADSNSC